MTCSDNCVSISTITPSMFVSSCIVCGLLTFHLTEPKKINFCGIKWYYLGGQFTFPLEITRPRNFTCNNTIVSLPMHHPIKAKYLPNQFHAIHTTKRFESHFVSDFHWLPLLFLDHFRKSTVESPPLENPQQTVFYISVVIR